MLLDPVFTFFILFMHIKWICVALKDDESQGRQGWGGSQVTPQYKILVFVLKLMAK